MNNIHEEIVSCPYNKSHRIPSSKFQRHLVKCEKNFPPDYKVICPYNATHRFSKSEIKEHIDTCPMRWTVEGSYILSSRIQDMVKPERNAFRNDDYNSYWGS